jgi:hypothetical protein
MVADPPADHGAPGAAAASDLAGPTIREKVQAFRAAVRARDQALRQLGLGRG